MKKRYLREELDFVLTDLLPLEKSNVFTNRYLYDFLQNNQNILEKSIRNKKTDFNNKIFDKSWHSTPLTFKIRNKKSSREISLINPLGTIESLIYKKLYYDKALAIIHKDNLYGIRTPYHKAAMTLRTPNKKIVKYSNENEKKQIELSLESSGFFYKHKPFSTITKFQNSNLFNYYLDKYDYLSKIDIQNFFPSIYTHTFSWLIANDTFDRKKLNSSRSIYTITDVFLQNLNSSKTNGILVGPEIFRFISEFLLVHIDQRIHTELAGSLKNNSGFKIIRFIDDYFIFFENEEDGKIIQEKIEDILGEFHLKINQAKTKTSMTSEIYNLWFIKLIKFMDNINSIFESETEKKLLFSVFRQEINNLLLRCPNDVDRIVSYLLSAIVTKLEEQEGKELELKMSYSDFTNLIMYIYVNSPSYLSTQKIVRILDLLLNHNRQEFHFVIEKVIDRYFFKMVSNAYINDFVNIITFLSKENINVSDEIQKKIDELMIDENNILILANYAICNKNIEGIEKINKIISKSIYKINWDDFFLDKSSWWIFIFFSWPKLSLDNREEMESKLTLYKKHNNSEKEKILIIDFLLEENNHFINWDFMDNKDEEFYFYTRNRTVFNPNSLDSLSISF